MGTRILGISLIILGYMSYTWYSHYTGTLIVHPWLILALAIVLVAAGGWVLLYFASRKEAAFHNTVRQKIDHLKSNGERIPVDLSSCKIQGREYTDTDAAAADAEHQSFPLHNIPVISDPREYDVRQSAFVYSYSNNRTGQTERFLSPIIPKDKLTLSFYLDRQKQTTLYVDKTNRRLYYFDLDFLND